MSVPVPIDKLRAESDARSNVAYLLTVSDDARTHAVHVALRWDGDALVAEVGTRSARNAAARPSVSLLYAARSLADYSLIVDGTAVVASVDGASRVRVTPTKAVLHRPAAAPDPSAPCGADCVPLLETPPARPAR